MVVLLYGVYGGIMTWRMSFIKFERLFFCFIYIFSSSENTKEWWIASILIVFGVDTVLLDGLFILLTRIWKNELLAKVMKMSGF